METKDSIFEFADKFGINSPFGNWITAPKKELSIKYSSVVLVGTEYQISLSIIAKNLKSTTSIVTLCEEEVIKDVTVKSIKLTLGYETNFYVLKFEKKLLETLSKTIFEGEFEFLVKISCDGLEAETNTFRLPKKATVVDSNKDAVKDKNKICFCNRDFTSDEFKNIIVDLRKKNGYKKLAEVLFDMDRKEKLSNPTFEEFTKNINATFTKYSINTCIRKVHFLAQTYHESLAFRATYEGLKEVPKNYEGGVDFQGRGIKQITHDYNYLEYYDKVKGTTYFKDKYEKQHKNKNKELEGVTEYMNRVPDKDFGTKLLDELKAFAPKLATEMYTACDSAGWFWDSKSIGALADKDNVLEVSKKINGSTKPNGLVERTKYTKQLKEIFHYEKCISKG
ncbi:MAG: hypothetical protein IT243_02570 [Bacteroidia bacterium]|nr:hypothetical protein [Bacteroidia bacterium]